MGKGIKGLFDGIQTAIRKAQANPETSFSKDAESHFFEQSMYSGDSAESAPPSVPQPFVAPVQTERRQEYAGKLLKCPNCAGMLSETMVVCPHCGFQITGRGAVSSVQAFNQQLMAIEKYTPKTLAGLLGIRNAADEQKLSLIRTFPIPNTVDDILEFVLLAIANIDTSLSKRLRAAQDLKTAISNAWVLKLQQAYQKAEIMFPDSAPFFSIRKMYIEKMKELKIKAK